MKRDILLYILLSVLSMLLITGTVKRNTVYYSELTLWKDCAEKNDFKDMRSLISYASWVMRKGDREKAWRLLQKGMTLKWEDRRFTMDNLKYLVQNVSMFVSREAVFELYQFIFEIDPRSDYALREIGNRYFSSGDVENARKAVSLAVRLFGKAESLAVIGDIYKFYGCYREAEDSYMLAFNREPNNSAWSDRIILNSLNFQDEAEFKNRLEMYGNKLSPKKRKLYNSLLNGVYDQAPLITYASLFISMGRYAEAETCLDEFTEKLGGGRNFPSRLLVKTVTLYRNLENFKKAEKLLAAGLERYPDNIDILMYTGYCFYEQGLWQQSLDAFNLVLKKSMATDEEFQYTLRRKIAAVRRMIDLESR